MEKGPARELRNGPFLHRASPARAEEASCGSSLGGLQGLVLVVLDGEGRLLLLLGGKPRLEFALQELHRSEIFSSPIWVMKSRWASSMSSRACVQLAGTKLSRIMIRRLERVLMLSRMRPVKGEWELAT